MADKLQVYNGALLHLGARTLASLTEERKTRRVLDALWAAGAVRYCLEQGYWNFAVRSQEIKATPSLEPYFGFRYAFTKPLDFVQLVSISLDEYQSIPLNNFTDEQQYWFADHNILYISFVSDDVEYGNSLGNWTETFTRFVELYLAYRAAPQITHDQTIIRDIEDKMKRAMLSAKTKDAVNQGAKPTPMGILASARFNGKGSGIRSKNGWLM